MARSAKSQKQYNLYNYLYCLLNLFNLTVEVSINVDIYSFCTAYCSYYVISFYFNCVNNNYYTTIVYNINNVKYIEKK